MAEIIKQLIPLVLSVNTLALTWLVGNRSTTGWLLGVIGQVLWFVFIFTWQVWGLLPLAIALTIVYARNLISWWREDLDKRQAAESHARRRCQRAVSACGGCEGCGVERRLSD